MRICKVTDLVNIKNLRAAFTSLLPPIRSHRRGSPRRRRTHRRSCLHRQPATGSASNGGPRWKIVYVGDVDGVKAYSGPKTRIQHGAGQLVIPGLVDAHIHPADIVDLDVCDLDSKA